MTNGMEIEMKAKNSAPVRTQAPLKRRFKRYLPVYLIALPGIVYLIINNYMPMIGLVLAFKKYSFAKGIFCLLYTSSIWYPLMQVFWRT